MTEWSLLLTLFIIGEMLLALLFSMTAEIFYERIGFDYRSIVKGMVERLFLVVALTNDYPHALTLFSALKLGTRLKHNEIKDSKENKFNDYYLIGNLISVSVAFGYVYLYKHLPEIDLLNRLLSSPNP